MMALDRADPLKKRIRKTQASVRHIETVDLKVLPHIKDVPIAERDELFLCKVRQCIPIFDFMDPSSELKNKAIKRSALNDLIEYINEDHRVITEAIFNESIQMVAANIFRALPISEYDQEDDDPTLEASWPHMQLVYEFFLRFLEKLNTQNIRKAIDQRFVLQLIMLFNSEDPRERDYLKTVLHRIYGKFLHLRLFIRKQITFIFLTFTYEKDHYNGISELLEIFGSIINGFAQPLKPEHKQFLFKVLIPLHTPRALPTYCQQLAYCIVQYLEKDQSLAKETIDGIIRRWPKTNSPKIVIFLSEIEDIIDVIEPKEFTKFHINLFKQIAICLGSDHFQISERALFYWNNDYFVTLFTENHETLMPIVFPQIYRISKDHWNATILSLAYNVLKTFLELDSRLFNDLTAKYKLDKTKDKKKLKEDEETLRRILNIEHALAGKKSVFKK